MTTWTADTDGLSEAAAGAVVLRGTQGGASVKKTIAANVAALLSAANYAAVRALLDLEAGTDFYSISATDSAIAAVISDTAYASSWNGVTTVAPSKNAVYDALIGTKAPPAVALNWVQLGDYLSVTTITGGTLTAGLTYFHPVLISRAITLSDLAVRVTTNVASSKFALAIYANNESTGRPTGSPLASTGDMSGVSTGIVTADITGSNVTLQPGLYWLCTWADSALAFMSIASSSTTPFQNIIGSATSSNAIPTGGANAALLYLTSSHAFNSASWPDVTGDTFTEGVATSSRATLIYGKAA